MIFGVDLESIIINLGLTLVFFGKIQNRCNADIWRFLPDIFNSLLTGVSHS